MTAASIPRSARRSACLLAAVSGLASAAPAQERDLADPTLTLQLAVHLALDYHPSVRAARAAKMHVIAVPPSHLAEHAAYSDANLKLGSLHELTAEILVNPVR